MFFENKSEELWAQLKQVIFVIVNLLEVFVDELFYAFVLNVFKSEPSWKVKKIKKAILLKVHSHICLKLVFKHFSSNEGENSQDVIDDIMSLKSGLDSIEASENLLKNIRLIEKIVTLRWAFMATDFLSASMSSWKKALGASNYLCNGKIFFSNITIKSALGSRRNKSFFGYCCGMLNRINLLGIGAHLFIINMHLIL